MANRANRRSQKKSNDATVIEITVDGEKYLFDTSTITYPVELELFNATKLTMTAIFSAIEDENIAPFMIAGLVFLSRRSTGEKVRFSAIAEAIDYESEIEVRIIGDSDEDDQDDEAGEKVPEGRAAD